jgi:OPA family glycerol-3-phosphate transporter-like MFS transporter
MSAIFPGVGAVSVLVTGWLSDRFGVNGRALLMFVGLTTATVALFALMSVPSGAGTTLAPLLAIGAVAFCLLGPYSYLGGAFALDFGGKQGSAVASGMIDGIGYIGGILAGSSVTQISNSFGWQGVFIALTAISAVAAIGAGFLYALRYRAAAIQQTAQ